MAQLLGLIVFIVVFGLCVMLLPWLVMEAYNYLCIAWGHPDATIEITFMTVFVVTFLWIILVRVLKGIFGRK